MILVITDCQHEARGIGAGIEVDRVFESNLSVQNISDLPSQLNVVCKKLLLDD